MLTFIEKKSVREIEENAILNRALAKD